MLEEIKYPNRAAARQAMVNRRRNGHPPKITKLHKSLFDKLGQSILRHPEFWKNSNVGHQVAAKLKGRVHRDIKSRA